MPTVTNHPIRISHFIPDIAEVVADYDRLRWYRSSTGKDGLYEAITAASAEPAYVTGKRGYFQVQGLDGILRFNGNVEFTISFVGASPLTLADTVIQINTVIAGVGVASDEDGYLQIASVATGTGASVEMVQSDAAPYLGLSGAVGIGLDVDTTLVSGTRHYHLIDQNSDTDYWYRVHPLSSVSLVVGDTSVPMSADSVPLVDPDLVAVGYIRLVDLSGRPDAWRVVAIYNAPVPNRTTDGTYGVLKNYATFQVGADGYGEIRVLRGATLDFTVSGTGLVRRITVPDAEGFDFLDASLQVGDEFEIQEIDVPFAQRTTL